MNATVPAAAQPGDLLAGKYRVDRVLGEGGMGIVLAARNEVLNQNVAVKLLRPGALANAEALGRFLREARAAASLRSEHVARVLDVGNLEDGRPYMVMEMLVGSDLGDVVDANSGGLPIAQAVDYVLQTCEAIAEAHGAGIIHRDLKPKNLFLTNTVDGRPLVKVLDFGIAKADPSIQSPHDMQLTKTAEVIGSPSYMSPEQLRSARNVDLRTDIWALGVILYELITGRLPFYAHTVTELVLVVVTEHEAPVRLLRPDVPEPLSYAIARCLAKRPEDRFQSVAELAHALGPFAHASFASAADRVRAVAAQSNRSLPASAPSGSLPPGGASSSRVAVHGGTSVAWGETQVEQRSHLPPSNKRPIVIGALAAAGLVAVVGGAAGIWLVKHPRASNDKHSAQSGDAMPLPPGRKDLPPIASAAPDAAAASLVDTPIASGLPDSRTGAPPSATTAAPPKRPPPRPAASPGKPDDLSNIGRR